MAMTRRHLLGMAGGGLAALVVGCGGDDDARVENPSATPTTPNTPTPLATPTLAPSPTPNPFQTRFETAYQKLPAPLQEAIKASPFYAGAIEVHQAQLAESLVDAAIGSTNPRPFYPMLMVSGSRAQAGAQFRGYTIDELVANVANNVFDFAPIAGRKEDVVLFYASQKDQTQHARTFEMAKAQLQNGSDYLGGMDFPYKLLNVHRIEEGDSSFTNGMNIFLRENFSDPAFWPFIVAHEMNHAYWGKQTSFNEKNLIAVRPGPVGFHEGIAEDAGVFASGYLYGLYETGNASGKLNPELFYAQDIPQSIERSEGAKGYRLVSSLRATMGMAAFSQANKLVFSQSFLDGKSLFKIYHAKAPEESKPAVASIIAQSTGIVL